MPLLAQTSSLCVEVEENINRLNLVPLHTGWKPARAVGQVLNEALTFCFVLGQAKMKVQDKPTRTHQYNTNLVPNIKYSVYPLHMTKVEPNKELYPNTCVRTCRLNGMESELSFSSQHKLQTIILKH